MLVLSRNANQRLLIGDDIVITIVAVNGDKVRIGIDAPRSVQILREELSPRFNHVAEEEKAKAEGRP